MQYTEGKVEERKNKKIQKYRNSIKISISNM